MFPGCEPLHAEVACSPCAQKSVWGVSPVMDSWPMYEDHCEPHEGLNCKSPPQPANCYICPRLLRVWVWLFFVVFPEKIFVFFVSHLSVPSKGEEKFIYMKKKVKKKQKQKINRGEMQISEAGGGDWISHTGRKLKGLHRKASSLFPFICTKTIFFWESQRLAPAEPLYNKQC